MNGKLEYPVTDESLDRESFTQMIVGLGHDEERAGTIYENMRGLVALYHVPLEYQEN